jgi:hypothetical protein
LLRFLLPKGAATTDDAPQRLFELQPDLLVTKLSRSLSPPVIKADGGAAAIANLDPYRSGKLSGLGGAANSRDVLGGIKSGFFHLLNFTTHYLMKARAGDVGSEGVAPLIEKFRNNRQNLRIYMIGHSFGCRAIAAAINALPAHEKYRPDTVLLLQGG